jgi:hypothetical protein
MALYKDLLPKILEWLLKAVGPTVLVALLAWEDHLAKLLGTVPSLLLFRILALLLSILLLLAALLYLQRSKFNTPPEFGGASQNIKTKNLFCTSCLLKEKIHSPLQTLPNGWRCHIKNCNSFFYNPSYKEPPLRPINYGKSRFLV